MRFANHNEAIVRSKICGRHASKRKSVPVWTEQTDNETRRRQCDLWLGRG